MVIHVRSARLERDLIAWVAARQGRPMFLSLGHTLKYDARWAGHEGKLAPDQFNPERWLSEEGQKVGAFLPFGTGLRMCVGYLLAQAEMKVCL